MRAIGGLLALLSPTLCAQASAEPGALGGGGTVADTSANAFGAPSPLLSAAERRRFVVGNSFFKQNWVTAPASTTARDGLGPLFNARSCSTCHFKDGRSRPPLPGEPDRGGLLIRIGVRVAGGPDLPHPIYGGQIQDAAVHGVAPEATVVEHDVELPGQYGDGMSFVLVQPTFTLQDLAYGPLGDDVVLSPRVAPPMIGLGLLEAIPAAVIAANADPDDRDGDGISGRVHHVGDTIGRFGWKAAQPTVATQTAAAFVNDIGITSALEPHEAISAAEAARIVAVSGGDPEIDAHTFDRVVFY